MMSSSLVTHCGAQLVSRADLDQIEAPAATATWFPIKHSVVVDTVGQALTHAGFQVQNAKYAVSREGARLFSTMDLTASVGNGVHLCVAVRNSTDRSLPLGFIAGSRVFICDNLAFRGELLVCRKHTRFGQDRFAEAVTLAVQSLQQFREVEADRIRRYQHIELSEDAASLYLLQAFEKNLVNPFVLRRAIAEWREPSFDFGDRPTMWRLLNAFTTALRDRATSNPQQYARTTMQLQDLLEHRPDVPAVNEAA